MKINQQTGGPELQLLTCTANLGNAQPDADSLAAWIPADGRCRDCLKHPQTYPIRAMEEAGADRDTFSRLFDTFEQYDETDQFDIIAIGLQESTFEPPDETTNHTSEHDDTSTSLEKVPSSKSETSTIRINVPIVEPVARKTLSKVSGLTATRDHLHKNKFSLHYFRPLDWADGTPVLHELLEARLPSYRRIVSYQRGEMRLEVFVNDNAPNAPSVQVMHVAAQNTGVAGLANKGGIVAELLINGSTRINILTAHLEAHEGSSKYGIRCSSLADILAGTSRPEFAMHDVSLTSHYSFAMGDLNFRTVLPNSAHMSEDEHKAGVRELVAQKDWTALNEADELHRALRTKDCLVGYQTLFCNFPPTFKVLREPGFSYIQKRSPSYTDRILYKTGHQLEKGVRPLVYEPIEAFASSDHKPVRAAFAIDVNTRFSLRPQLARRGSMLNMLKRSKRSKTQVLSQRGPAKRGKQERIQLFVSNIACTIGSNQKRGSLSVLTDTTPNPYLLLVSYPEEVLRKRVGLWKQLRGKVFFRNISKSVKADGSKAKSALGWPRSSRQMGTYEPDWGDEDVHCEVLTHRKDGSSIDLSGAIFRLALMNYNATGEDTVIGSYPVNLVNLLRECQQKHQQAAPKRNTTRRRSMRNLFRSSVDHRPRNNRTSDEVTSSGDQDGQEEDRPRQNNLAPQNQQSLWNVSQRSNSREEHDDAAAADEDDDPMATLTIDGPLLKNGRETGRIQCKVECWWIDESAAAILGSARIGDPGSDPVSRYSRRSSGKQSSSSSKSFPLSARRLIPKRGSTDPPSLQHAHRGGIISNDSD